MTDKETARQQIVSLVEKFRALSARERSVYNEQQTREYFVLPLFRALGWDTSNPSEMTAEEQVSHGFVDFAFYLDGVPRFFLETKKIPTNLDDPKWAKQAVNYAYLKGVTWAVLTDFEGLKVLNAEWKETNPTQAIFLDLQWDEYADRAFEDLWLLSKPAIQAGEMDRLAERFGKKTKKDPVSKTLFAQLTMWRRELFKEIRGWASTLWAQDVREVDGAVQRLLDRLIFIRAVEDREIEPPRLRPLIRQYQNSRGTKKDLFHGLLQLFRELDDLYNATLFAASTLDHFVEIHNPDLLIRIIEGLYEVPGGYASYDFNAIDADVLGTIYEQYLSFKVLDPKGEDFVDLAKRQKRKKQGIYYTPQSVVRYIVQSTLGRLLESGHDPHSLRILDPACGSGSFLIEAFDVLDRWLTQHEPSVPSRERRLRILRENLYGVDLDEQAVEVARLNLLLRAANTRERLPLLTNIRCGNSLISDLMVAGNAAFNWEDQFAEIFAQGGFDVVIGNPPYGASFNSVESEFLTETYEVFKSVRDSYVCFVERAMSLLRTEGVLSYVIPASWIGGPAYSGFREFLLRYTIDNVVSLPFDIFADAYVDTLIVVVSKKEPPVDHNVATYVYPKKAQIQSVQLRPEDYMRVKQSVWTELTDDRKLVLDSSATRLVARIKRDFGTSLGDYLTMKRGVLFDPSLLTENKTGEDSFPYFEGDVYRYQIVARLDQWVEYGPKMTEWPKDFTWFEGRRILLRRLVNRQQRLMASITDTTFITNKNLYSMKSKCADVTEFALLAILNSRLVSYLYLNQVSQATKDDFPQVTIRDVLALPCPQVSKNAHDRLAELAQKMLSLKQQYVASETSLDDRRHILATQIEVLDQQIDSLVYELYGLTDDEIAIVEGHR